MVEQKSNVAFRLSAEKAMADHGYVIIAENGWVVKKYSDGRIEPLEELDCNNLAQVILD